MTRVLHVDDDPFFRGIMRRALEGEGFQVIEAADGEEGMRRAREGDIDMILLDIRMPRQDGFETLHLLKDTPETWSVPVCMCSSLGSKEDVSYCFEKGASEYFVKGHHDPASVVRRLKALLTP